MSVGREVKGVLSLIAWLFMMMILSSPVRAQIVSGDQKIADSSGSSASESEAEASSDVRALSDAKTVHNAEDLSEGLRQQVASPTDAIGDVAWSLAVVLLLIFLLAWFVRRFLPAGMRADNKQMKVLASLPLGGRDRLLLVDVAGTQMVLGVSSGGISCLHLFDTPVVQQVASSHTAPAQFGNILQRFKAGEQGERAAESGADRNSR